MTEDNRDEMVTRRREWWSVNSLISITQGRLFLGVPKWPHGRTNENQKLWVYLRSAVDSLRNLSVIVMEAAIYQHMELLPFKGR